MSPIEMPSNIQLVEKRETRTSRGMLSKGWYHTPLLNYTMFGRIDKKNY